MTKQRQHFVPKVYLKQFSRDKLGEFYSAGPKPRLLNTISSKNAAQVCYIDDFYTLGEDAIQRFDLEDNLFLEKTFDYERQWPRIVGKFSHKNAYLNLTYHEKLIDAYLSLKQRNAYYRNHFRSTDLASTTDKHIKELLPYRELIEFKSGEAFDSLMNRIKATILSDEGLPDEMHKMTMLETAMGTNDAINDAKQVLHRMALFVLEPSRSSDYFVTSDNPGFSLLGNKVFNTNFGAFDSVGFPINSRQLILLRGASRQSSLEIHRRINFIQINEREVDQLNYSTIFNAVHYVFCESKKYLTGLVDRFEKEHGPQQSV